MKDDMRTLRTRIHADFVLAVLLTVLVPIILLLRSVLNGALRHQIKPLLAYWRASSLLMVTVYLLIAHRPYAMVSGVTARIAIAWSLMRFPYHNDAVSRWWVWLTVGYCLAGAAVNMRQINDAVVQQAYAEATQVYAQLLHRNQDVHMLGRVGDIGLMSWVIGALMLRIKQSS